MTVLLSLHVQTQEGSLFTVNMPVDVVTRDKPGLDSR